jgi:iron complex transport system permease protein
LLIGTVMGFAWWVLQGLAFVGAVAVLSLMWWLLRRFSRLEGDISIVLLLGIVLSALLNAGVNVVLLLMPERALRGALFWMMGDLAGAGQHYFAWWGVWLCLLLALPLASKMSALMRGALMAHAVGISVQTVRVQLLLLAGLATAIAVSEAGAVGFVGLVVPHFVKLFSGQRAITMRGVMLLCVLWGGVLLVLADGLARMLIAPMQLPVGVLTIALGAPFLAWQLLARLRSSHTGGVV